MDEQIEVEIEPAVDRDKIERVLAEQNDKHKPSKFQKRINDITRMKGEAERRAHELARENAQLKSQLLSASKNTAILAEKTIEEEIKEAKRQLKEAAERGDSDLSSEANAKLADATARKYAVSSEKQRLENVRPPQPETAPTYTEKTREWVSKNPWFTENPEMQEAALAFDRIARRKHEVESDEYFADIEKKMRGAFPDYEWDGYEDDEEPEVEVVKPPLRTAPASPRSLPGRGGPTTKVRLTQEQLEVAQSLGIPAERYAQRVANLKKQGLLR